MSKELASETGSDTGDASTTMKAIVYHEFGAPSEVLRVEEVPRPVPGPSDVLVQIHASSANPYDWHFIRAQPYFIRLAGSGLRKPKKPIPGGDLAGVVEAVGANVTKFEPGDDVYAFHHGSFAEYNCVPQNRVAFKPKNLSFEEAASLPLVAVTALQGLRDHGGVESGDNVLIIGASGGIGTIAVQMAKAWGAEVTGVCSTKNLDLVRSLGADYVIDYLKEDITQGDRHYDLVFQLAGTYSPRHIRRVMAPDGTLIQAMGDGGKIGGPMVRVLTAMAMNPFVGQTMKMFTAEETAEALDDVRRLVESGAVKPVIDSVFALADAGAAVALVEDGSPQGKVVISITPDDALDGGS